MPKPKAILLDLDNTVYEYPVCQEEGVKAVQSNLAELAPGWTYPQLFGQEYNDARSAVNARIPEHAASHCRLLYFKLLVEKKFGRSDLALLTKLHDTFWRGYLSAMKADEGCLDALQSFKQAGMKLAWVTNFTTERQIQKLERIGLADAADFLITSEEAGADKPSPKPFQLALEKLRLKPQDVCMVGDDWEADIEPAKALGIRAIWRRRGEAAPKFSVPAFSKWSELNSLL